MQYRKIFFVMKNYEIYFSEADSAGVCLEERTLVFRSLKRFFMPGLSSCAWRSPFALKFLPR